MRRIAQRLLTLAALLGAVSLGVVLLCAVSGVRPVVIQSGSMGEALPTGSLAFQRVVDAASVAVGDIVTVPALGSANTLVTHRVTALGMASGKTALTLKGDANSVPDSGQYVVDEADRVLFSVPLLGSILAWVTTPSGILALLGYTALMVTLIARTQPVTSSRTRSRGVGRRVRRRAGLAGFSRRTRVVALTAAGTITAAAIGVPTAYGAWSDQVSAPAVMAAVTVPEIGAPSCSSLALAAELSWNGVAPAPATGLSVTNYEYVVNIYRGSSTTLLSSTVRQPTASSGQRESITYTVGLLSGLLGNLVLIGGDQYRIEVQPRLKGTSWVSNKLVFNITVVTVVVTLISCG